MSDVGSLNKPILEIVDFQMYCNTLSFGKGFDITRYNLVDRGDIMGLLNIMKFHATSAIYYG